MSKVRGFAITTMCTALVFIPISLAGQTLKEKPSAAKRVQATTAPAPAAPATTTETDDSDIPTPASTPEATNAHQLPNLPVGTVVKMRLETALSTSTNKAGDQFAGRVIEDVTYQGKTVIPVGSSVRGRVIRVAEERRYKGLPTLELHPENVTVPKGDKYMLNAIIADTPRSSKTSVDDEGRIKGSGMDGRDKVEIAGGTGLGAGMGALISRSGTGTLVGAAVGGGAAVVYWLSKRKSATLAPGTEIIMELSRPMTMSMTGD
jgi:hypothetical protein